MVETEIVDGRANDLVVWSEINHVVNEGQSLRNDLQRWWHRVELRDEGERSGHGGSSWSSLAT